MFDPLYVWSLVPRKAVSQSSRENTNKAAGQKYKETSVSVTKERVWRIPNSGNEKARSALLQVWKKLLGVAPLDDAPSDSMLLRFEGLPVSSLVSRLIRQATAEDRLCLMFAGWSPWV